LFLRISISLLPPALAHLVDRAAYSFTLEENIMSLFTDLFGTTKAFFKIGFAGPRLKDAAGNLVVRNSGDTADAEITASKVAISGNVIDLNSDAAGAATDWKYTLQRPVAGMSAAVTLTLPVDDGTPGQVMGTDGSGNLAFVSAGSTASSVKADTASLAFGTANPLPLVATGAGDVVDLVEFVIDTSFNGAPVASVGVVGTTSKYVGTSDIDLTQPAGTVIRIHPGLAAQGAESLIATYTPGGATVGSARILIHFSNPA
jgi:hypothetical protein